MARASLAAALLLAAVLVAVPAQAAPGPDEDTLCMWEGECTPCPDPIATQQEDGSIRLEWTPDPDVVEWMITRGTDTDDSNDTIATLPGNVTTYVDSDLEEGKNYWYRLLGRNEEGNLGYCWAPVMVTEIPNFPTTFAFVAAAGLGALGYAVLRRRKA